MKAKLSILRIAMVDLALHILLKSVVVSPALQSLFSKWSIFSKHYLLLHNHQQVRENGFVLRFLKWTGEWKKGQRSISVLEKIETGTQDKQFQMNLIGVLGGLSLRGLVLE